MQVQPLPAEPCARIRVENTESASERTAIRLVHQSAFGGLEEADLVDNLPGGDDILVSLVAEIDFRVVGHILFSRMWIDTSSRRVSAVALAPVSVLPEYQGKGIGTLLVRRGLELLRERGEEVVVVVGHPQFYPRFGFSSEQAGSLSSPFPREAFMAVELRFGALDGLKGSVVYPLAFGI